MPVSLTSPDTGNLYLGKGIVSFKEAGGNFRDVGNVPEFEVTLNVEELEHFTSRAGTRSKDLVVVLEKSGTVRWVMEEHTPDNMGLFLLGPVDENAINGPEIEILASDAIEGEVRFVGTNDQGPNWSFHAHNIRILPTASINLVTEDWGTIEVSGEMLLSSVTNKFGTAWLTNLPSDT